MAPPISMTLGPYASANAALFAGSQTPVSGTALTLTGASADVPRAALLTFGSESAARQMLIVGTINALGEQAQEILSVPTGGGTVATIQNYLTVTKALPLGGGWTAAVTLGTVAANSGGWKFINAEAWGPTEVSFNVIATGTVNWSIVLTNTDINAADYQPGGPNGRATPTINTYSAGTGLSSQSGSAAGVVNDPFIAWKAVVNSGTGSVVVEAIEAGMH